MISKRRDISSDPCSAFRRYAALGLDRRKLLPHEAYEAMRGMCPSYSAALDMLAVYDTLRLLCVSRRNDCLSAVRDVYFWHHGCRPAKNDITFRVRRIAFESNCDERTVYRRLKYAKDIYRTVRKNEEGLYR